ncbi:MAG TPA: ABC transporter ATP-binding protein [Trueperaceae bacterium]
MNAIETHDLGKRYGPITALAGVELTVPRGVIVGVLGPSGAGKTTLVKCLGLLTRPSSGRLALFGRDTSQDGSLRRQIGYMPQEPALYEELSARSNVSFFSRGTPRRRIDALLELLELGARASDPVLGFSGGMKQRVSLACVLAADPELLLLDEPTAGIDPILRLRFWQEFRKLKEQGKTLLVSTHQMDEALHCDRLLVIRGGRVLIYDTPEHVMARGGATATLERQDGERLQRHFDRPEEELPRWLDRFDLANVARLRVQPATLEEVLVGLIEAEDAHVREPA